MEVGAGTFHQPLFLKALGLKLGIQLRQPSRRPTMAAMVKTLTAYNTTISFKWWWNLHQKTSKSFI